MAVVDLIIQMRCGFIEKQQAWLAGQRADQGQFLLFTTGELMRVRVHLRFQIACANQASVFLSEQPGQTKRKCLRASA